MTEIYIRRKKEQPTLTETLPNAINIGLVCGGGSYKEFAMIVNMQGKILLQINPYEHYLLLITTTLRLKQYVRRNI